jgi:hypothetical protein
MDRDSHCSRSSKSRCLCILFLLFVLLLPALARAGEPKSTSPAPGGFVPAPVLALNWHNIFSPVQSALSNRRRMIQFATVGMCIGLYILMRK